MQWRTPITLAVLLAILMGAAYYGWHTVVSPVTSTSPTRGATTSTPPSTPHKPATKQVCVQRKTFPKGTQINAGSFRVNVFNAGGVSGQAGNVLAALQARGFRQGVAANPPARVTARNVTILTLSPNQPQVRLVQEQFRGPVKLAPGPNLAPGVDVVVGASYVGLEPNAPSSLTVTRATTVCVAFQTRQVTGH